MKEWLKYYENLFFWVLWAVVVFSLLWCGDRVFSQEVLPFENLHIKQALPDYCYAMPRPMYEKWVIAQNTRAYQEAQRLTDVARQRNPWRETYVQDNDYTARVAQKQKEHVSPNGSSMGGVQDTKYTGRNTQNVYRSGEVSGGPVVVLNPYAPRTASVLFKEDGTAYVADPDRTLKHWQAQRLLNEYLQSEEDWQFINQPGETDAK